MAVGAKTTSASRKFSSFLVLMVPPFGIFGIGQRSSPATIEEEKVMMVTKEKVMR